MRQFFYIICLAFIITACSSSNSQWGGQTAIKKVNTETRPIQLQLKATYDAGKGVFFSNEFEGARLNGVARVNDTLISILITAENEPINTSPWYAFKIWSEEEQNISLKITYPPTAGHRYFPKFSKDKTNWISIDSSNYIEEKSVDDKSLDLADYAILKLDIEPDTLWVSAQELLTTVDNQKWVDKLTTHEYVSQFELGKSVENRSIPALRIGGNNEKGLMVVLSRQHPPEVTGYLGMQAFVEEVCSESPIAKTFREKFTTYVIPMINPDGVYHGHWRHNKGGIDLNRDWEDFNQKETGLVKDYFVEEVENGATIYFMIDFHSTWKDIYYTIDTTLKGNMPGLVPEMIAESGKEFENYTPNIKPRSDVDAKVSSMPYFFFELGAESLVYEIGDDTPREFVKEKGRISAQKAMEIMLKKK